jgi:hypothetical protein
MGRQVIVPVELALPCRLIRLDLRVGPEQGVTTLEDLVARAILAGSERPPAASGRTELTTTEYLSWLFAVPERVVVDVIGSLWNKGYVTVDFDSGHIELSPEALARLARQESLAADGEIQTKEFLFEPITGMILPERMGRGGPGDGTVQLPLRPGVRESDLPALELVRSVQAALRYERMRSGRTNVLEVGFGSPALHDPVKIRWLHLRVAAYRDPQTDRISVAVDEALLWPSSAQRQLGEYLGKLADDEPDNKAVQELKGRAQIEREPTQRLADLLRRMGEQVAALDQIELPQVPERHRVLGEQTGRIRDGLARMRAAQARVSMVSRPAGHAWALEDLVEAARSQLVLVAPSLDYDRMRELLPGLRKALSRGIQLVVIWGRAASDRLPEKVETLLDELELRPGARVVRAPRSAQTEACVIIQDDCRALVGSHSMLGPRPLGARETAVLVEPAEGGPAAPLAVIDLLRWARSAFPRWSLGQRIELTAAGPAEAAKPVPAAEPAEDLPVMDVDPAEVDEETIGLWAAGWADVYAALADMHARIAAKAAAVEAVRDGEHRAVLWQGLRAARQRLVIADDRVSARTANSSMVRHIRERRAAGAMVQVIHPELPSAERSAESIKSLRTGPDRVRVRLGQDAGRVMVADDEVLIGSFSPLGDAWYGGPGRRVSQLGLHIRDEGLAADLAAELGLPSGGERDPATRPPAPARSRSADAALLLYEARTLAGPGEFGRIVLERLRAVEDPFAVLEAWRDTVPAADLRAAVAAVLSARIGDGRAGDAWLRWLIEDAWRRDAFVAAAILAGRLAGRPGALDGAAIMAAALEAGPLGDVIVDAALYLADSAETHPAGALTAGAAGALAELLMWGGHQAAGVLGLLAPGLPPNWRALCERVEDFRAVPLPLADLAADQTKAEAMRALDLQRAALVTEIDKMEALRARFNFDVGVALHDQLFVTGGLLARIREAAGAGIVECHRLVPSLPRDVREHMNRLIAAVGEEPMEWLKHVHFLHRVEDIVRSVRLIGAGVASGRLDEANEDKRFLPECVTLGTFLADRWDGLYIEARELGAPYELPMLALLTKLTPLMAWARERS